MSEENLQTKLIESLVEKKFNYWKEEFIKRLKEDIENAQEDYANLDWVSKGQIRKIIDKLTGDLK